MFRTFIFTLVFAAAFFHPARCPAQDKKKTAKPKRVRLVAPGWTGVGRYRANSWGIVRTGLRNNTDSETEKTVAIEFKESPGVQFASKVWAPANSRRVVEQPVRLGNIPVKQKQIMCQALLLEATGNSERRLNNKFEGVGGFSMFPDRWVTSMIVDPGEQDEKAIDAVAALRVGMEMSKGVSYVNHRRAPTTNLGWDAIHNLVIAKDKPQLDSAQMSALRQWVTTGGMLWIMLDQVDPTFVGQLLQDDWTCAVVDQVELPQLEIIGEKVPSKRTFDDPPIMTRVIATDMQVFHRVNGWPASMGKPVGQGQLIVTTLAPSAWVVERPADKLTWKKGKYKATAELMALGNRMIDAAISKRPAKRLKLDEFVAAQIGSEVISRPTIITMMMALVAALSVIGFWLSSRQQLDRLLFIAPALSLLTAGAFVVMGEVKGRQIPLTSASAQLVQVMPGGRSAIVSGEISIYSPTGGQGRMAANNGGVIWPNVESDGGTLRRMVWTDLDRWSWQERNSPGVSLPARNVRNATFNTVRPLSSPVAGTITFDAGGVKANVETSAIGNFEDVILAGPSGALKPNVNGNELAATPSDVLVGASQVSINLKEHLLRPGQYYRSDLLSNVQQRRQNAFRQLLDSPEFPAGPTLVGWASGLDLKFDVPEGALIRDSALVAVPLKIVRPESGTRVLIPAPFITFDRPSDRFGLSTMNYNPINRGWVSVSRGGEIYIRFAPPPALMPLKLESARLFLDIRALGRTVTVSLLEGREGKKLASFNDPQNVKTIELDGASLDDRGRLGIGIHATDIEAEKSTALWWIERVDVEMTATVLPPGSTQP